MIVVLAVVIVLAFLWQIATNLRVPYGREIVAESSKYGIPPPLAIAQVKKESAFNPSVVGTVGEIGLMQIRAGALADVNRKLGTSYTLRDLYNPRINLQVGFAYMGIQLAKYGNIKDSLAAYNAGTPNSTAGQKYAASVFEISRNY